MPLSEIDNLLSDIPSEEVADLFGGPKRIPKRWGRMNRLSRLLLVHTADLLTQAGFRSGEKLNEKGFNVGLIGVSRRGSLATDLEFLETMAEGPGLASPFVFGYTLPNIPLAEVSVAFGLTGPVYALFAGKNEAHLLGYAEDECRLYSDFPPSPHFMLACAFDCYQVQGQAVENIKMSIVRK